jgi:hypothetical protein
MATNARYPPRSSTGARLLAELGDDPHRFATARGLRAYAGIAHPDAMRRLTEDEFKAPR